MYNFCDDFLIAHDPDWIWADFRYKSLQIAHQLRQDEIQNVALWFDDCAYFACALLACWQAGIRVLLPANLLAENQAWLESQNAFLFTDNNFSDYGALQTVANRENVFCLKANTEICLRTSGSSGNAKVLYKTAAQMWLEAQAVAQSLNLPSTPLTIISSVSPQHHYGLSYRVMLPLTQGFALTRRQLSYPELFIRESNAVKEYLWVTSPTLLSHFPCKLVRELQGTLHGIVSSGGALSEKIAAQIRANFPAPLIECYGSTETGAIAFRRDDGLWTPTPLTQVGLNRGGALWVNSPWLNQVEQTADGAVLHGSQFQLLGRLDRIIKFADKRISLNEIEHCLLQHPWVRDSYLGVHPESRRPTAWVALNSQGIEAYQHLGRNAVIKNLRHYLAERFEKLALPRYWRFSHQLPRNTQSKLSYADFVECIVNPQQTLCCNM